MTEEQYAERRPVLKLKPSVPLEAEIQPDVRKALEAHPRVGWIARINSAAGRLLYPDGSASRWMRFGFIGCSDYIGQLICGRFLAVEIKRPGKGPTDDQGAFLDNVRKYGGVAFVARNAGDVFRELDGGGHDEQGGVVGAPAGAVRGE